MENPASHTSDAGQQLRNSIADCIAGGASPKEIERTLISKTASLWRKHQSPPPLSEALWHLNRSLPAQDSLAKNLSRLFDAHHQINLYTFQALHNGHPGCTSLLEDEGDICQALATEIFMAWYKTHTRDPVSVADKFLRLRLAEYDDIPAKLVDRTDLSRVTTIVGGSLADDFQGH